METLPHCLNNQILVLPPFPLSVYIHLKMHWVKLIKSYTAKDYAGTSGIKHFIKNQTKAKNLKFPAAVVQRYLKNENKQTNKKTQNQTSKTSYKDYRWHETLVKYSAQKFSTATYRSRQFSTCLSGNTATPLNSLKSAPGKTHFSMLSNGQNGGFYPRRAMMWLIQIEFGSPTGGLYAYFIQGLKCKFSLHSAWFDGLR